MEAYIRGIGNISPQHSWDNGQFLPDIVMHDANRLKCIEPEYKEFIKPMQMRRMSRILKMGIAAAARCLQDAGVEKPDAMIMGTGLGMFADTEKFLKAVIDNQETLLTPTSFIQSTHNTIGAHIAVMLKCNAYNLTYVNDYLSFESALLDSLIRLKENTSEKILMGGIDEMTNIYFKITENAGWWKKDLDSNLGMLEHKEKGTIAGEGASFFVVTGEEHPDNYAKFAGVKTFYKPVSLEERDHFILNFLSENELDVADIDLVISGVNGDYEADKEYYSLQNGLFNDTAMAYYKHLCGEYFTASSFASWLGARILKEQAWPAEIMLKENDLSAPLKNILIYNQHHNTRHGLILLTAC
ncbi:MAG: beta-ketoacyl synthase chain length factor [Bacteroidota bacterium]